LKGYRRPNPPSDGDSQPFSFADCTRESYEFTATGSIGAAQGNAQGCLTVDAITTAAGGFGGDTYDYLSTESTWDTTNMSCTSSWRISPS
jgi:hypothetical protein